MAINSVNDYLAAQQQQMRIVKTSTITTVAGAWFDMLAAAGNPGAGTIAGTNTANGVVPTDATTGHELINAFAGGATGYLTSVDFGSNLAARLMLVDYLFKAGAYAFNANTTLASQPSYLDRTPDGAGAETELWFQAVTAFTGNPTITVTYTNQAGVAGRVATFAPGLAPTAPRCMQIPLQPGDSVIQKIESVVGTGATAGTFNLLVVRPLQSMRVRVANDGDCYGIDRVRRPVVYAHSAIGLWVSADSTVSGLPEVRYTISSK